MPDPTPVPTWLPWLREAVADALEDFLDHQAERIAPLGDDAGRLVVEARRAVAGGKRLRAAFCWVGYAAVRPDPTAQERAALVRAAAALELLHASALVHDDLMDASDTRRGQPATHRRFAGEHAAAGWTGDAEQYGAAAAILLGDLLLTWSDELLRRCGLPLAVVVPALEVFDLTRSEVVAGQFLDVSVQARGAADAATAMTVLRYKSAKYSVERPLHVGAALAGASPDALAALSAYGVPVGEAFQLRDDLLGVFGDPGTTGKPAGDDLVEGKRTVLVAHALAALAVTDTAAAERLDGALGTALGTDEVAALRDLVGRTGAGDRVEDEIEGLTSAARTALAAAVDTGLLDPGAGRDLLDLARAATERTA